MARNQEKAQSMLYRFREAQAAELGVSLGRSKNTRRPRLASSVNDLRECEKWRGEVLREVSRKVSKIQDFGLTDYEIRDLNDEINKLLREKLHWENQIIALGGANYKRAARSMTDDGGKEIPGTRGYKYFGRAKDLPGVKELLTASATAADEASDARHLKYQRFANLPPSYYGDEDEDDGVLLEEEERRERERWLEAREEIREQLGLEDEGDASTSVAFLGQDLPRRKAENIRIVMQRYSASQNQGTQMGPSAETETDQATESEEVTADKKRKPAATSSTATKKSKSDDTGGDDSGLPLLAQILPALDPAQLGTPRVPDRKETEAFILRERKRMLREEYVGK